MVRSNAAFNPVPGAENPGRSVSGRQEEGRACDHDRVVERDEKGGEVRRNVP